MHRPQSQPRGGALRSLPDLSYPEPEPEPEPELRLGLEPRLRSEPVPDPDPDPDPEPDRGSASSGSDAKHGVISINVARGGARPTPTHAGASDAPYASDAPDAPGVPNAPGLSGASTSRNSPACPSSVASSAGAQWAGASPPLRPVAGARLPPPQPTAPSLPLPVDPFVCPLRSVVSNYCS